MQYCVACGGDMNTRGSIGTAALPLFSSIILMGAATTVMVDNSDELTYDANQIMQDTLLEISTYLTIENVLGKFSSINECYRLEKIVLLIRPLLKTTINIKEMMISLQTKDDALLLPYGGNALTSSSGSLFHHNIWENTSPVFNMIVLRDEDRSFLESHIMNEDFAGVTISIPQQIKLQKGESFTIQIIPSKGTCQTLYLELPTLCSTSVFSFYDI
jgi:archaellin